MPASAGGPRDGRTPSGAVEIAWIRRGDPSHPLVLLIPGLGVNAAWWPEPFLAALAAAGLQVVALDNRDSGASTWVGEEGAAYGLGDMAADAAAVIAALGTGPAHVVGASMGALIAQLVAADHPQRVASLACLMAGAPQGPPGTPAALAALFSPPPATDPDSLVAHGVTVRRIIGSPSHPTPEADIAAGIRAEMARGLSLAGIGRHAALLPQRAALQRAALPRISCPTLILHGEEDPVLPVEHARLLSHRIAGSRLERLAGWGHDLPAALAPQLAALVAAHALAAEATNAPGSD